MAKFIVCVGPPCSGKSTWARKLAQKRGVIRINRDDLRTMFKGGYVHGDGFVEKLCTLTTYDTALAILKGGFDVVLDNTNCTVKTVKDLLMNVHDVAEVEFKVFDIPYWKQRYRNFWRWFRRQGPWIPKEVSQRMDSNFQEVKVFIDDYNRGRVTRRNTELSA